MGAVSGLTGTITHATGHTVLCDGWRLDIASAMQDQTPLAPAGGHEQMLGAGLLLGATGTYTCKLAVAAASTYAITGTGYDPNPEEWFYEQLCEARETTPLAALWRTYVEGLISSRADLITYIDDTEALPLGGSVDTATLTIAAGMSLSLPYVVENMHAGVDTEDTERRIVLGVRATAAPTPTGAFPGAGTGGVATFLTDGTLVYNCAGILVTALRVRVNRRTSVGRVEADFVSNGAIT